MKYIIRAPGKLILTGEHAVVYGKSAIVTSINIYMTLKFRLTNNNIIIVNESGKGEIFNFSLTKILCNLDEIKFNDCIVPKLPDESFIEALKIKISNNFQNINDTYKKMLLALIICLIIGIPKDKLKNLGLKIEISNDIPVSNGVGSSAAFSSLLAAMILIISNKITHENFADNIHIVNEWAFLIEHIFHGKPSGMDNTAVVYGGTLLYKNNSFRFINQNIFDSIKFLLIYTGKNKNTKEVVEKISSLKRRFPKIIESIFETINYISETFYEITENSDNINDTYKILNDLLRINQSSLESLNLDCLESSKIKNICNLHGYANKITGAGCGGMTFIMYESKSDLEKMEKLQKDLKDTGFEFTEVETTKNGICMNIIN